MNNHVVHFEVSGHNGEQLRAFYQAAFGWTAQKVPGPADHGIVDAAQAGISGGIGSSPDGSSHVTFYVQVDELEAMIHKVVSLGGRVALPPTPVGAHARIAHVLDPEGHRIGLSQAVN